MSEPGGERIKERIGPIMQFSRPFIDLKKSAF
jgi:hypothetical protein